jgi:endonuclease YncB( thermonuclease family)
MVARPFRRRRKPGGRRASRLSTVVVAGLGIGVAAVAAMLGLGGAGASASPAGKAAIVGAASVVDADTLEIHGERIRLTGVDAPESHQKCRDAAGAFYLCGSVSANALDLWIAGNPVTCVTAGRDRYDRALAECSVRGASIQDWLVSHGYAIAYRSFSKAYVPQELKAREARAGVWAGEFIEPWNWRKGQRLRGEKPTRAMLSGAFAPT